MLLENLASCDGFRVVDRCIRRGYERSTGQAAADGA